MNPCGMNICSVGFDSNSTVMINNDLRECLLLLVDLKKDRSPLARIAFMTMLGASLRSIISF